MPQSANSVGLPKENIQLIWQPLAWLVYENVLLGTLNNDPNTYLRVLPGNDTEEPTEGSVQDDLIYPGNDNSLIISQRVKLTYSCQFQLLKFPFDRQTCDMTLLMNRPNNNSVMFVESVPAIIYHGPKTLNDFLIKDIGKVSS